MLIYNLLRERKKNLIYNLILKETVNIPPQDCKLKTLFEKFQRDFSVKDC